MTAINTKTSADNYKCTGKGCPVRHQCARFYTKIKNLEAKFAPFEQYCAVEHEQHVDNVSYSILYRKGTRVKGEMAKWKEYTLQKVKREKQKTEQK